LPTMHRNHSSEIFSPPTQPSTTSARYEHHKGRQRYFQQRISMPAEKRATIGHHNRGQRAIIHLNTQNFGDYASRLAPLHRSDNPSPNLWTSFLQNQYAHPNAPKPIHPDKEHFCSSTIKLGANIRIFSFIDLFRNDDLENPKLEFPHNNRKKKAALF